MSNPSGGTTSDGEAWYDAEIAPALADLAKRCNERGMSFVAVVEYQPGDRGCTYMLTEDAGLAMQMVGLCSRTAPNVDSYVISLRRYCKAQGIEVGASFVMRAFGK